MELNDKIKGALVGYAFGDALGLGTEFMTRTEASAYYPDGLRNFNQIIRDVHRKQWKRGEWTTDTVLLTRSLESILETGRFKLHALALNFKEWYDSSNEEHIPVYNLMCHDPEWIENPIQTAHKLWITSRYVEASNDSLHRALVTALTSGRDELMEHTRRFVLMTHDDSRCVTSAKIMAKIFYSLLHKEKEPSIEELISVCNENDPRTLPFLQKAWEGDIEGLGVDNEERMTWTRVAMATALWAYWHSDSAEEMIYKVVDLGGDADTNAALTGALAGLKYGYHALPEEKTKIIGFDYLIDLADRLTDFQRQKNKESVSGE